MLTQRYSYHASLIALAGLLWTLSPVVAERPNVRWNAPPSEWVWNIPEEIHGVTHGTLQSESMNREVGYNVLLPPGYETDTKRRYPVVYYLHGASGSELSFYEIGDVVQSLRRAGKIGDAIYVFPNGGHFSKYRDWKEENVKAETLIIRELIPHIDQTYRTVTSREGRALCGWSMGGDASLRFAFKYPDMFCAAATMSAAIDWGAEGDDTIFAHSRSNADKLRNKTGLMMVVGEEDGLHANHRKLLPHLDELKLKYDFQSAPGVGHNLGEMKSHYAADLVQFLDRKFASEK